MLEEQEIDDILTWFEELAKVRNPVEKAQLVSQLSTALEGFMGIEEEMLIPVLAEGLDQR